MRRKIEGLNPPELAFLPCLCKPWIEKLVERLKSAEDLMKLLYLSR